MTAFLMASMPFIINSLMGLAKRYSLVGNMTTPGKRAVLAILAIVGVVAASFLNGTPIDAASLSGLTEVALMALAAFISAHGSYVLFWNSTK